MSTNFGIMPYSAISQAYRKRNPYVKDVEEIPLAPLDPMRVESPREIPLAPVLPKDADQQPMAQAGELPIAPRQVPLFQQPTAPQPLSREDEIDLAPIAESDKTREGYQGLYNAGTSKPTIPDHSAEHHGFWGNAWQHVKHAGKGALVGAYLGSRAGGAGALGGALLGGLTGAVSSHAADVMEYNTFTEPRWEHENQVAEGQADRKLGVAQHFAQTYGTSLFDPEQQTAQAKTQEDAQRTSLWWKQQQERQNQEKITETQRNHEAETQRKTTADKNRVASQRLNTLRHIYEGGGMTDPQRQEFASLAGLSGALGEAYQKGEADIQPDEKGRLFVVHKRTGYKEPVIDPDNGQQMISFKLTQEVNKKEIAANAQAGANYRATMRGAGTGRMTRAQAETQAARDLGAGADGMLDNPKWKTAYDAAFNTAKTVMGYDDAAAAASAESRANKQVKEGKRIPANKHPAFHLKVQGLMGGQAASQSVPAAPAVAPLTSAQIERVARDMKYLDKQGNPDIARTKAHLKRVGVPVEE